MIKNTHLYNIVFSRDDYMEVLMKLENHQDSIYPVKAKKVISNLDHATSMEDRNPYNEVLDELYNVMDVLHIEKVDRPVQSAFLNVREILDYISEIHQKLDDINEIKRGIKKDYYENQEAIELITCLNRDRISIDDIHELKYVALRFGKLPLSQIEKIKYFDSYPFVYQELSHTDQFAWIVYGGVEHSIGEIDNIFSSMNFEEVKLPKFAHGKMEEAVAELKAENKTMEAYLQELDQRIEKVKEDNEEQLLGDFWKAYRLKELYKKGKYVVDLKTKAAIYAFSSFDKEELEGIVNVPGIAVHELPIDTYQDQGVEGPVYVENNLEMPFLKSRNRLSMIFAFAFLTSAFVMLIPNRSSIGGGLYLSSFFFALCPKPPKSNVKNSRPLSRYTFFGIPYFLMPRLNE